MDIESILNDFIRFDEATQKFLVILGLRLGIFLILVIFSLLLGRYTLLLVRLIVKQLFPKKYIKIYESLLDPLGHLIKLTGTLILWNFCLKIIASYQNLYQFLKFFIDLGLIISIAWFVSRLFKQFVRIYGVIIIDKLGKSADDFILVGETVFNVIIGFTAIVFFAQTNNVNLLALITGLGISGIALAFAAQRVLEQLLGTIVLYLDRPYVPGEYIRVNFNPHAEDIYGRVESIGLRSTKIRLAAKNTLLIVPNSLMATKDIENITRGKKVMVLLYLDFVRVLEENQQSFVTKVIQESTNAVFGIDPGSTEINFFQIDDRPGSRARITFFILGSSEDSTQLRKRLLELANTKISQMLEKNGMRFSISEPTIYVDSPIPI
ncbi:mechanosensitive ion channel domain-containing protein [Mastigocoleus sp. MO_188.B34]|uniref:mechanosensitive ion channel family protein n=1 Tax=Mastigocoleus sp. MO_188.B34 TaxID=3036635 RepID=UPI0026148714|nr:mechanosensitive ion channel domain-containing protein [Mastigocoleus sp. MO_188.B34]MDJ0692918.1 mechanosensitive ion channel [Mastigocoleus sp. MO_188.B34]